MAKPRKGKAKVKVTASGKRVSYGQAGKAKGGGPRVKPGTSKGDSYCARSYGIKKRLSKKKQNDPNTPNNLQYYLLLLLQVVQQHTSHFTLLKY